MSNLRLIARLDIKGRNLIKGVRYEGVRVLGDPQEAATQYYKEGIDELIYIDNVASLYGRNSLKDIIENTTRHIFIPLTVCGGIRSIDDVSAILRSGADKVAINTAAVKRPELIREVSRKFGSQCAVLYIEAKRNGVSAWEAYTDMGREHSDRDVIQWAKEGESLGAGEILLASVDQDGTQKGFDINLLQAVSKAVSIPVIASGGMGTPEHLVSAATQTNVSAIAMANILHYRTYSLGEIREYAISAGLDVRIPPK